MTQPPEQPYYPQQPQPEYEQPGYQQPGYQQPGYQQPGYQQPGYQQPGYQQPGYQRPGYQSPPQQPYYQQAPSYDRPSVYQPGYPQSGPPAPPKKSGARTIVLIVLAVLVVLGGGGAAVAYVALKDDVGARTRLVAPENVAGRAKITDNELQKVATEMVNGMKSEMPAATSTIGAFYGDPAKQDMFMIAGASGPVRNADKQLNDAFRELAASGLKLGGAKDVPPGPLGGHAKCADGQAEGVPVAMCVWADSGSVGIVAVYFKKVDQIKNDFVTIRGDIEKRD